MRSRSRSQIAEAGFVATAAVDAWLAGLDPGHWQVVRRATKPLLMPLLAMSSNAPSAWVRVAQSASWVGDVALLQDRDDRWFRTGVVAFGCAHVAYTCALLPHRSTAARERRTALATTVFSAATAWRLRQDALRTRPALADAVGTYGLVIGAMASAAALVPGHQPGGRALRAGVLLFLASDSLIGLTTFAVPDAPRRLETVVMATYTVGQLLIARGLGRLVEASADVTVS